MRKTPKATSSVHPHVRGVNDEHPVDALVSDRFIPTCVGLIFMGIRSIAETTWFIPTCVGLILARSKEDTGKLRGFAGNAMKKSIFADPASV